MSISPYYTIHRYREDFYKVVAFKGVRDRDIVIHRDRDDFKENDEKLASNLSRARSAVLQYALCNPWDFFITTTLDESKHDRYALDSYTARFPQWIRDMRKAYDSQIQYLLVPQAHDDGAWHMHGLVSGVPPDRLRLFGPGEPWKLRVNGFLNWPDYQNKFGFCSLGRVRDPVAVAFYITRYITRDLANRSGDLGKHLYFHSRPLNKAVKASEVYFPHSELDAVCTEHFKFCSTGLVENAPWYYPYQFDGTIELDIDLLPSLQPEPVTDPLAGFRPWEVDPDYEQMEIPDSPTTYHLEALK